MSHPRSVIAVGAGHAHLHLAAYAGSFRKHNAELVLIDPSRFWYSGLATGMLGGQYACSDDTVDPQRLVEKYGGRYLQDRLVGIDPRKREIRLESGHRLAYDLLSLNLGSEVPLDTIDGLTDTLASPGDAEIWPVKPIRNLCTLRERLHQRFTRAKDDPPRVVVIGGGATGPEVAANIAALAASHHAPVHITLLSRSARLFRQGPPGASRRLQHNLERRHIHVHLDTPAQRIEPGRVLTEPGDTLPFDLLVLAPGLRAPSILHDLGLPLGESGGLLVNDTLQSVDDPRIFGAGDCIHFDPRPLPRLGVFGVRQAPVLLHNLLATLEGEPLDPFRPQSRWLTVLNLGDGTALAARGRLHWHGRLALWTKDYIDRSFLRRYRI